MVDCCLLKGPRQWVTRKWSDVARDVDRSIKGVAESAYALMEEGGALVPTVTIGAHKTLTLRWTEADRGVILTLAPGEEPRLAIERGGVGHAYKTQDALISALKDLARWLNPPLPKGVTNV